MYTFQTHLWIFLYSRGHRVYEEGYTVGYTVICSSVFCRGLDQMTLQGDLVSFKSTSCVYIQSQLRQASLTTEVGIKARCIPHVRPCGPPAFWQTPGPDWKICARFGGQVWCDPGMIYMALVGVHTICATLAKFSFGVSDSFEVKCIRWEQMGPPTGIRGVSSKSCGTLRQLNCPPLYSKVQKTCNAGGVRAKELDVQVLSRSCQN